ncbi:MAG: tRNA (adenosine(37)-N6)-threonylcarbamoyltransferase complex dimerization subunit type 1 TsaB [Thiotrichales bacterium]|nr:tRNA (adenosine(37)-N6)-threonylcarbamoyltransferase complex dimerization subunit type 1 TsaB [Thiotrichales bacterium]
MTITLSDSPTILALDTSTAACSVALRHQGETYALHEMTPQQHAQRILPMIDTLLAQAGITGKQVDVIAFGEGPGAFTGVRIAAGVTQGLALGWDCRFVALSSLASMAYQDVFYTAHQAPLYWCAMMDARMNEVYWQEGYYDPLTQTWRAENAQLLKPEQVVLAWQTLQAQAKASGVRLQAYGDVSQSFPDLAALCPHYHEVQPNAMAMLNLAQRDSHAWQSLNDGLAVPRYLRNQVAETLKQRQAKAV